MGYRGRAAEIERLLVEGRDRIGGLKPYRAVPDPSIRRTKHPYGCVYVGYSCTRTHRTIMGLVRALLGSTALPG